MSNGNGFGRSVNGHEVVFEQEFLRERSQRIVYLTPPHAPSTVTTISPNGSVNIGSFEQTMVCSNWPPVIILAISPKSDTLHNLVDTGECVIGFAYPEYIQQVYDAGVRLPRGESELPYLKGFTLAPSVTVAPPRIEQCWFSGEGRVAWMQEAGDHTACGVEIKRIVFDRRFWSDNKVDRRVGLPALYYATSGHFFQSGEWQEVDESDSVKALGHAG